jgi:hypothetical protein
MLITLKNNLIFTTATVAYQGATIDISNVLVDTGSATTILAADEVAAVKIKALPQDTLHLIRGVGGVESVFTRSVDYLQVGKCCLSHFQIEVGKMAYGFEINGILGMDFLIRAKAIINLLEMRIEFQKE